MGEYLLLCELLFVRSKGGTDGDPHQPGERLEREAGEIVVEVRTVRYVRWGLRDRTGHD